jgi:hypothetical protein
VSIDGLVLTAFDDAGVWWNMDTLTGWWGSSGSSLQLSQKQRAPGAWPSPRQLTSKTIVGSGWVEAPDQASLVSAIDRLNAAAAIDARLLTVSEAGLVRSCIVYRQDEILINRFDSVRAQWSVQLAAADPRKFGAPLTASTTPPSSSGGLTIPFTIPFVIGSTVVSGTCSLTNLGNAVGPVKLRIDGPIVGPQVTHVGSGLSLTFASSLSLGVGEWIEIDTEAQTVLANGQSSRNGWVTSRGWFGFEPGDNDFAFSAISGSGLLRVTATPAWL